MNLFYVDIGYSTIMFDNPNYTYIPDPNTTYNNNNRSAPTAFALGESRSREKIIKEEIKNNPSYRFAKRVRKRVDAYLSRLVAKLREPWYRFAALYASTMGGGVSVDELIKNYPYDLFDDPFWDRIDTIDLIYDHVVDKLDDIDDTKKMSDEDFPQGDHPSRKGDTGDRGASGGTKMTTDELKKLINDTLQSAVLKTISGRVKQEVKTEPDSKLEITADEKSQLSQMADDIFNTILESEKKAFEGKSVHIPDRTISKIAKSYKKQFKTHEPKTSSFTNEQDVDIDYILNLPRTTESDIEIGEHGFCILKPEFRALIELSRDSINGLCVPQKDFTSSELCMSPIINSQFAIFMCIRSSPANPLISTRPSFRKQPYIARRNDNNSTTLIFPGNTRYMKVCHDTEQSNAFDYFSKVERGYNGVLIHSERLNNYNFPDSRSARYRNRDDDEYDDYNNNNRAQNNIFMGTSKTSARNTGSAIRRNSKIRFNITT